MRVVLRNTAMACLLAALLLQNKERATASAKDTHPWKFLLLDPTSPKGSLNMTLL